MKMVKMIVVTGLPGTGKTTFAQALATEIKATHLNTDIIRDALGKRGQYDTATKAFVYENMLQQAETALHNGVDVIIDGTFYQQTWRKAFVQLAKKQQAAIYWIEIKADEALVRTRVSRPRPHSEADYAVYLKIKAAYEPIDMPCLELWSDRENLNDMIARAKIYVQ